MISLGELIAGGVISVSGDWSNDSYFQPGINEVVFDGQSGDQFVSGDGLDFYNLLPGSFIKNDLFYASLFVANSW